jgi:hypothetical protein
MYGLCAFFLVLTLVGSVFGELSDHWGQNDNSRILAHISPLVSSAVGNSRESFFALHLARDISSQNNVCNCDSLAIKNENSVQDSFYSVRSLNLCDCPNQANEKLLSTIKLGLMSNEIPDLVAAIGLANNYKVFGSEQVAALMKLRGLILTDGELSLPLSDAEETLPKLHMILDLLLNAKEEEHANSLAVELFDKLFAMLPGGDGEVLSDPALVYPLSRLSGKKLKIEKSALKLIAEQLINLKFSQDPVVLYNAYKSLEIIRSYKAAPYHGQLLTHYFSQDEDMKLQVEVFDVLGKKLDIDELEVISLKVFGKDSFAAQNVKEKGSIVTIPSSDLSVGRYGVNLAANLAEKQTTAKFQSVVVVAETLVVDSVAVGLSDSKQVPSDLTYVKKQNSLVGFSASAVAQEFVHVAFKVSGNKKDSIKKPHQTFVRLTYVESSVSRLFVASKVSDGSTMEFNAVISVGDESETFDFTSGNYLVSILVADAAVVKPIEWVIGSIELKFPSRPVVNLPLYAKSLLHTSDTTLQALPEIEHQMRPPAKRASNIIAGSFTLLTVIALLGFIGFILSLKPNFSKLTSLSSILFILLLGCILALYYGYWLAVDGVSFYDTIKYLCILLPITIFVGKYSLNSIATARLEKEKTA